MAWHGWACGGHAEGREGQAADEDSMGETKQQDVDLAAQAN